MSTIKQALAQAGREIGEAVKDSLTETRNRIRSDRAKIEALEEYLDQVFDPNGKDYRLFDRSKESVALDVAEIIGYNIGDKK